MEDVHLSDLMRAIADAFIEMKSKIEAIERTLKDMQSCKKEEKETSNELDKIQPLPLDQTTSGKRILMADTIKVLEQIDNEIVFDRGSCMEKTYTKAELQTILMFMGCKNWHAKDISESIYSKNFTEEKLTAGQIEQSLAEYGERFFYSSLEKVFSISKRVFDREMGICILLGGTSGCGKSTLASILASRLGINTVISTDNIRHMMRSVYPVSERPELFRSSYEPNENPYCSAKVMSHLLKEIINGFEKQAELLFPCVQDLITSHLHKNESLIIEGVHLTVDFCQSALSNNPNCIPLIIYVGKSEKHAERFAIRSKYMTLEPNVNKYIKYFENIRTIQNHLCIQADRSSLPKVDNTNLDRSLGIIHRTIISYLKNLDTSNSLFTEFSKINEENLRSKEVLKMIRYKRLRQRSSSDVMMGTIDRPTNG